MYSPALLGPVNCSQCLTASTAGSDVCTLCVARASLQGEPHKGCGVSVCSVVLIFRGLWAPSGGGPVLTASPAHGVDREAFMCCALTVSGDFPNICGFSRNVPTLFKESFKTPAQEGERWEIITGQDGRLL